MKARFDETQITLTSEYKKALIVLMKAECKMMAKNDIDDNKYWYWGRCTIENLSAATGLSFEFGEKSDMPKDGKGRFAIIAAG